MKNLCSFYIIFQVLKVLLIKICKREAPDLLFIVVFISFYICRYQVTLKNCSSPITRIAKKITRVAGKTFFFTLFKLNITFYFKCYLHHNCSVNLNWNNTQLYSSAKPLHNVPSSVFWFVNFCFLPFLRRTSVQKWKKIWFCYVHKWID